MNGQRRSLGERAGRVVVALLAVLALGATACSADDGDGDDGEAAREATTIADADGDANADPGATGDERTDATDDRDATPSDAGGAASDDADPVPRAEDFPCDLLSTAEVEGSVGADLDDGRPIENTNIRNDVEWRSRRCRWEGADQEVVLDVAEAAGFASGSVACVEPSSDAVEVTGPGDAAYWTWEDLLVVAELQVCRPDALVIITIDTWDPADEAGARAAALDLAALVDAGI